MALPSPIGRQKEVLVLPARGHFVVLGTAGSGKTTLAILRSAYLADSTTDHHGKTLLVTFNRALVAYLRHLKERSFSNVIVENYHTFARGYLASRGKMKSHAICSNGAQKARLIRMAVNEVTGGRLEHPFLGYSVEFFAEEIRWIGQHGVKTLESYLEVERVGRSGARLPRALRPIMFRTYEIYREKRRLAGWMYDWDDLATAVCDQLQEDNTARRYRHVVIDEGQDFSPEMIRSLALAITEDGSVTFFGDAAQQIYGQRISWKTMGLTVPKKWEFKENYRNSRQIARLALAISRMPFFKDVADLVEPIAPTAAGPLPTLVECSAKDVEIALILDQAVQASRLQSVAILLRNRDDESAVVDRLPKGAIRLHRDMTTWQGGPGVRYGTYHSAKGLEFDTVLLPFLSKDRFPDHDQVATFGNDDAMSHDARLLYVGVTRAKTRLIMTYTGTVTSLLPSDTALFERVLR